MLVKSIKRELEAAGLIEVASEYNHYHKYSKKNVFVLVEREFDNLHSIVVRVSRWVDPGNTRLERQQRMSARSLTQMRSLITWGLDQTEAVNLLS